jgi:hypothetical protein
MRLIRNHGCSHGPEVTVNIQNRASVGALWPLIRSISEYRTADSMFCLA